METKHTQEYAKKMAEINNTVVSDTDLAYSNGYMKAIEETGVTDLLEALIEAKKVILGLNPISCTEEQMNENAIKGGVWDKIQNAINKATTKHGN